MALPPQWPHLTSEEAARCLENPGAGRDAGRGLSCCALDILPVGCHGHLLGQRTFLSWSEKNSLLSVRLPGSPTHAARRLAWFCPGTRIGPGSRGPGTGGEAAGLLSEPFSSVQASIRAFRLVLLSRRGDSLLLQVRLPAELRPVFTISSRDDGGGRSGL